MPKFEQKIKINRAFRKIAGFSWDGLEVLIERA